MKRIWRTYNIIEASHLRNLLESAGIRAFLRNENLSRLAGEVPFDQVWPEVWITEDAQTERALTLVRGAMAPPPALPSWTCARCNEMIEGQFSACWKCGGEKT